MLGLPISAGIIAGLASGCQVPSIPPLPKAVRAIVESGLPPENPDVFHAFLRGSDVLPILEGPEAQWAVVADPPARVEATPDLLRLISTPGHPVWASPRLPYAPLQSVIRGGDRTGRGPWIEDVTWLASIAIHQRYMIVCEVRFAGEPGALLIQATPFDVQVFQDPDRPNGGTSTSVSRIVDRGEPHYWRLRLDGRRFEVFIDGSLAWTLEGPRTLSRIAFGETRTDPLHGGAIDLRDIVYVRRPVPGGTG